MLKNKPYICKRTSDLQQCWPYLKDVNLNTIICDYCSPRTRCRECGILFVNNKNRDEPCCFCGKYDKINYCSKCLYTREDKNRMCNTCYKIWC